jgi:hypothetical protein
VTSRLPDAGLFAIVVTWMEADVIEATVRNALAQGCERVLVVDNDSPDDTVARAVTAGAELACTFSTPQLDEALKIRLMNEIVARVSAADGRDHIWWLWLDADEFVHGPRGATLSEFVGSLDRRYRVVGTRYFNHFPDRRPASLAGFHPLDLQPLCRETPAPYCAAGHNKHSLQRWDRAGPPITSGFGFHDARSRGRLREPPVGTFTHHFPYRCEDVTRARLDALCGRDASGHSRIDLHDRYMRERAGRASRMTARFGSLDSVYAGDWTAVSDLDAAPRHWADLVDGENAPSARWYAPADLDAAIAGWRADVR